MTSTTRLAPPSKALKRSSWEVLEIPVGESVFLES